MAIWYFNAILVYFTTIGYYWGPFWCIFPILVCCTKKNLASLLERGVGRARDAVNVYSELDSDFFLIPWLSFDSVVQLKRTA
jgi:hypothetical protein